MAYGWAMVGTPVAFLSAERFWQGQHFVWFLTPIEALIAAVRTGSRQCHASCPTPWPVRHWSSGSWASGSSTGCRATMRTLGGPVVTVPVSWWVYTVGVLLIAYSAYFTDSIPRYTMAAFPLFVAFAWKLPRAMEGAVVGVLACLQGALLVAVLGSAVHPMVTSIVP